VNYFGSQGSKKCDMISSTPEGDHEESGGLRRVHGSGEGKTFEKGS